MWSCVFSQSGFERYSSAAQNWTGATSDKEGRDALKWIHTSLKVSLYTICSTLSLFLQGSVFNLPFPFLSCYLKSAFILCCALNLRSISFLIKGVALRFLHHFLDCTFRGCKSVCSSHFPFKYNFTLSHVLHQNGINITWILISLSNVVWKWYTS